MEPRRSQVIEHEILRLVLAHSDHLGYSTSLPVLNGAFREILPDVSDRELVNTLKRLQPKQLKLKKWGKEPQRFIEYPHEIQDEEEFFYRHDFRLEQTPYTGPYIEELGERIKEREASKVKAPAKTGRDDSRRNRVRRLEKLGIDHVRRELLDGGFRLVGSSLENPEEAWTWLQRKEKKASSENLSPQPEPPSLIASTRLEELRKLTLVGFDLRKLIRLCEELNVSARNQCHFATAMLTRGIIDHVPPLFGYTTFKEVANNYAGGGKSFRDSMQHLEGGARKIADAHLHSPIRKKETLPTLQQVNFAPYLDVLLSEIVRISG